MLLKYTQPEACLDKNKKDKVRKKSLIVIRDSEAPTDQEKGKILDIKTNENEANKNQKPELRVLL